ncbi:hypothetical protein NYE22_21580 [Bacillus sp. FSL K6-1560]|uniref:hypothetical protein n=1 Tax=Bacillus sp. FSL K6-1560 TaxID=2975293 RepID=UPI003158E1D6
MSFINLKSLVKKVNMKPKGITEIVLEVSTKELGGSRISRLSEMIDKEVQAQLESETVQYVLEINAKTEKPITNYTVDRRGIVNVADPEPEQLEAELGLSEEKPRIEEKPMEIDREIVDTFITEGTPPVRDGFPENIDEIAKRRIEGESYRRLADELGMSPSATIDLINEYRKEIAPIAEAWWDWKQDQAAEAEPLEKEAPPVPIDQNNETDPSSSDEKEEDNQNEGEHGAA